MWGRRFERRERPPFFRNLFGRQAFAFDAVEQQSAMGGPINDQVAEGDAGCDPPGVPAAFQSLQRKAEATGGVLGSQALGFDVDDGFHCALFLDRINGINRIIWTDQKPGGSNATAGVFVLQSPNQRLDTCIAGDFIND